MNVDKIRDEVKRQEGKTLHFKFNGSRNQIAEFDGKIIETYHSIFVVKLVGDDNIKSFSYNGLVTSRLDILK